MTRTETKTVKLILMGIFAFFMAFPMMGPLAAAEVAIPTLSAHVTDLTATLSSEQRADLESKLIAVEQEKGSQLAILILPSTLPEDIAQFGIRLADAWKIGRKRVDDGAILIVAKEDRAVRIEVGRGLEGAIPDAIAKRIIEEQILPRFRTGNFFDGINAGSQALIGLVKGEPLPLPQSGESTGAVVLFVPMCFAGLLIAAVLSVVGVKPPFSGGLAAIASSAFALFFAAPWLLAVIIGVAVFMISMGSSSKGGYSRRGGFGSSPWGGGGWSSSGGGWSGGGGSFGGGGASGKW